MAATMVGMDRKNENSSAEARDMPASCPPAMVDMERDVPGKTADKNLAGADPDRLAQAHGFHLPGVNAACGSTGAGGLRGAFMASTIHITMPPISREHAHDVQALQMLADDLGQKKRGNRGDHKGNRSQAERMSENRAVAILALRKSGKKLGDAAAKIDRQAQNGAQLNDDGVHLPIAVGQTDME